MNSKLQIEDNIEFWNEFYSHKHSEILLQSSFADFIYNKYIKGLNDEHKILKIGDIGCGNLRDSLFFASKGNNVFAVDQSNVISPSDKIEMLNNSDAEDVFRTKQFKEDLDIIYMRWFLHSMPYEKAESVLALSKNNITDNGLICIEVRSKYDSNLINMSSFNKDDKSYTTTHKRWLYSKNKLISICKKLNFEILLLEEGEFSPNINTETDNPLLIRAVLKSI